MRPSISHAGAGAGGAVVPTAPAAASTRYWEIDFARGLMLVLMTVTHLPTRLTDPLGQPFGFVSAAEGFVLLSAFVSGMVYSRIGYTKGVDSMRSGFWRRALKVYFAQGALLLFLFTVITIIGVSKAEPAVLGLIRFYLAHPGEGLAWSLLLVYQPALLDILPMYILFMLLSPWVLAHAMVHGWRWAMVLSAGCWLAAQFGFTPWIYARTAETAGVSVPFTETGAFDTFAWQLLWFFGLWLGASRNAPAVKPLRFRRWMLVASAALALYFFYWRHYGLTGQAPFGDNEALNMLWDKWRLGPLRLLNLAVLGILAIRFGPELLRLVPRQRWLEDMGSASLPVFSAHLVAVLMTLAVFGGSQTARPWWGDGLLLAVVFGGLYATAYAVKHWELRIVRKTEPARPA
ncbi:conserved membrane hypothetical protein [Burkholderiales bacterium 8X]|nr:conserved membrane hypothetical protein [Burkholderiales bacterium 8X]